MFNNFHGFHLVEELHKRNLERAAKRLNSKFFKILLERTKLQPYLKTHKFFSRKTRGACMKNNFVVRKAAELLRKARGACTNKQRSCYEKYAERIRKAAELHEKQLRCTKKLTANR